MRNDLPCSCNSVLYIFRNSLENRLSDSRQYQKTGYNALYRPVSHVCEAESSVCSPWPKDQPGRLRASANEPSEVRQDGVLSISNYRDSSSRRAAWTHLKAEYRLGALRTCRGVTIQARNTLGISTT